MSSTAIHEPVRSLDDDPEFQNHERFSFEPSEPDNVEYMSSDDGEEDAYSEYSEHDGHEHRTSTEEEEQSQQAGYFPMRKSSLRKPSSTKPRVSAVPPPPRIPSEIFSQPESPTTPTSTTTVGPDTAELSKKLHAESIRSLPTPSQTDSDSENPPFPDLGQSELRSTTPKPQNAINTTPDISTQHELLDSPASPSVTVLSPSHPEHPASDLASSPTSPASPVTSIFSSVKNNGSETQSSDYSRPDTELITENSELSRKLEAEPLMFDAPPQASAAATEQPRHAVSPLALDATMNTSPVVAAHPVLQQTSAPPLLGPSPALPQPNASSPRGTSPTLQQSFAPQQPSTMPPLPQIPLNRTSKSSLRSVTSADGSSGIPPVPPLPSTESQRFMKPAAIQVGRSDIPPVPPLPVGSPTLGRFGRPESTASSQTSAGASEYGEPTKAFVTANRSKSLKMQPSRYKGQKSISSPAGSPVIGASPVDSPNKTAGFPFPASKTTDNVPSELTSVQSRPVEGPSTARSRAVSDGAGLGRPPLRSAISIPELSSAKDGPRATVPPSSTDSKPVSKTEPNTPELPSVAKEPTVGTAEAIRASIRRSVLTTASSGVDASSTERSSQYTYRSSTSEIRNSAATGKMEHWPVITEEDVLTPEEEAMIARADQMKDDDEMSVEDAIMMYMHGFESDDEPATETRPVKNSNAEKLQTSEDAPPLPPLPQTDIPMSDEDSESEEESPLETGSKVVQKPMPAPPPRPPRPEIQIPEEFLNNDAKPSSAPSRPMLQVPQSAEEPSTFLNPPSPNNESTTSLAPPKLNHRRTSTQIIAGELDLPESSPRRSPKSSPQTPRSQEADTLRALTANATEERPLPGRDRYGFKTANQWVTSEEYALWNKGYSYYLQNRKKKWVHFMNASGLSPKKPTEFPPRSDKLKRYVRKGFPPEWRGAAWFYYGGGYEELAKHPGLYEQLVQRANDGEGKDSDREHIERDLHRTFPDNIRFKAEDTAALSSPSTSSPISTSADTVPETPMIESLRRVLRAFALHNSRIGYCQSLNFLAGTLLLFLNGNEEKAFILLNIMTSVHLPGTHGIALEGANVDIGVLMSALKESLPAVWVKLDDRADNSRAVAASDMRIAAGLPTVSLATTAWFMSAFISTLPIETAVRAWDVLFYEGSKTLFRIALAIFKLGEREIREKTDPIEVFQVVQTLPRRLIDANAVLDVAMRKGRQGIGSVSQEVVETRREERRELYKKEAEKVFRIPPPPPPPPPDEEEYNQRAMDADNRLSRSASKSSKLKRMVSLKRSATTVGTTSSGSGVDSKDKAKEKEKNKEVQDKNLSRSSSRARVKRMMSKKVGLDADSKKPAAK